MKRMRSGSKITIVILIAAMAMVSSCRTSQQTKRTAAANSRNAAASQTSAKGLDSLYMVQNKLLTIIDTMSNVLAQDRSRIHQLEIEVARLKSQLEQQRPMPGGGAPPPIRTPSQNQPSQNYTAPSPAQVQSYTIPTQPQSQPPVAPPNDKYSGALKAFNDGRYMDALTSFDELARNDQSSPYAPNYLYWKGESLYALGQYDESIRTFHDVLTNFPSSTKTDDSEFKIGAAYEKMGDRTNARAAYERLILSYPESEYNARAQARLNKLK